MKYGNEIKINIKINKLLRKTSLPKHGHKNASCNLSQYIKEESIYIKEVSVKKYVPINVFILMGHIASIKEVSMKSDSICLKYFLKM